MKQKLFVAGLPVLAAVFLFGVTASADNFSYTKTSIKYSSPSCNASSTCSMPVATTTVATTTTNGADSSNTVMPVQAPQETPVGASTNSYDTTAQAPVPSPAPTSAVAMPNAGMSGYNGYNAPDETPMMAPRGSYGGYNGYNSIAPYNGLYNGGASYCNSALASPIVSSPIVASPLVTTNGFFNGGFFNGSNRGGFRRGRW